jgi:type I restriction enzyme S subunit
MGTTGRSAVIPDDIPTSINTKHLAAITFDEAKANPYFMCYSFQHDPRIKNQIAQKNKGAIMDGLNLGIIKDLDITYLPKIKQDDFESMYHRVEDTRKQMLLQLNQIEQHYKACAQRVFRH